MSYVYKPFPLDAWVSNFLKKMGIYTPEDIDETKIANDLRIYLIYTEMRSFAKVEGNFKLININKDLDKGEQREIFFHELCHILRHEGCQYKLMPTAFRELQERDANHFTRYAAIPFHMLGLFDWKSPTLAKDMSQVFKVSEELCQYRIDHIYRNLRPKERVERS